MKNLKTDVINPEQTHINAHRLGNKVPNPMLQIQHSLVAHIEQQVKNREIGLKPMFALIDLIVSSGHEIIISNRMFRTDGISEIDHFIAISMQQIVAWLVP